jgi:hypothetical protein
MPDASDAVTRRTFVATAGLAILTVLCLPDSVSAEGTLTSVDDTGVDRDLVIHSTPGLFKHAHDLLIPRALLREPPLAGVKLVSSKALRHQHEIALSQAELRVVMEGGTVRQKASSHLFLIALANGQSQT